MNKFLLIILLIFSIQAQAQTKKVVLIGIDGLGSYGIKKSSTPVMDSILNNGAYSVNAKAGYPTLSSPNWSSMIRGVKPKQHKIKSNQWEDAFTGRKDHKELLELYPTVFKVFKDQYPDATIAGFLQWSQFAQLVESDVESIFHSHAHEDSVAEQAINFIINKNPAFTFIHLDLVDKAGHAHGLKSDEYRSAVEKSDELVGKIIRTVSMELPDEEIVFIVSSDHGFTGKHHGGFSPKTKRIPWMAIGAGVKSGKKIKSNIKIFDTAPTIARILALPVPAPWKGKVLEEIFDKNR